MDLSKRIKTIREKKNMTQASIAEKLAIDRSNYHRLENRGNKLTMEQVIEIANALDISLQEFLFDNDSIQDNKKAIEELKGKIEELEKDNEIFKNWLSDKETLVKDREEKLKFIYKPLLEMTISFTYIVGNIKGTSQEEIKKEVAKIENMSMYEVIEVWQADYKNYDIDELTKPHDPQEEKPHSTMKYRKMYKNRKTK